MPRTTPTFNVSVPLQQQNDLSELVDMIDISTYETRLPSRSLLITLLIEIAHERQQYFRAENVVDHNTLKKELERILRVTKEV